LAKFPDAKHVLSINSLNPAVKMEGVFYLVDCPNRGTEVATAANCWPVKFKKLDENGALEFSSVLNARIVSSQKWTSERNPRKRQTLKMMLEKLGIFMKGSCRLRTLRQKIRMLERSGSSLMVEIVKLKKVAEFRRAPLRKG
jgi:hypothetical protein